MNAHFRSLELILRQIIQTDAIDVHYFSKLNYEIICNCRSDYML